MRRGLWCRQVYMIAVVLCVAIGCWRNMYMGLNSRLPQWLTQVGPPTRHQRSSNEAAQIPIKERAQTNSINGNLRSLYKALYDEYNECIHKTSNEECSFPLLTEYHQRCGHFPRLTSWRNFTANYPGPQLISSLCRVRPITSATDRLTDYIMQRNITSIAVFGDSNGQRSYRALISLMNAAFKCVQIKHEPYGFRTHLHYYTMGSGLPINATVERTCKSCVSTLFRCTRDGMTVAVEYISMFMTRQTVVNLTHPVCASAQPHPLCSNMTQQEYVFKHYFHAKTFPQLILIFGETSHDLNVPLTAAYDGMLYFQQLLIAYVPGTTHVVWYDYARSNEKRTYNWEWHSKVEGPGFHINEKLEAENHFLSQMLVNHRKAGFTPNIYSFFDISHMKAQLRGAWEIEHVHSTPMWYNYLLGYTATLLPSLPLI